MFIRIGDYREKLRIVVYKHSNQVPTFLIRLKTNRTGKNLKTKGWLWNHKRRLDLTFYFWREGQENTCLQCIPVTDMSFICKCVQILAVCHMVSTTQNYSYVLPLRVTVCHLFMKASSKLTAVAPLVSSQGHDVQRDVDCGSGLQGKLCPGIVRLERKLVDGVLNGSCTAFSCVLDNCFLFQWQPHWARWWSETLAPVLSGTLIGSTVVKTSCFLRKKRSDEQNLLLIPEGLPSSYHS
jgi:hypothetical protein